MNKKNLVKRAEKWKKTSEKVPLMGYTRNNQPELMEISAAIIKAICKIECITPFKAKEALKIAGDIISEEMEHDAIL